MTHHDHGNTLQALAEDARSGQRSVYEAGQVLLERVGADVPDDEVNGYLNRLRDHADDGVAIQVLEHAIGQTYPERPEP